jgi:hypothetical protein
MEEGNFVPIPGPGMSADRHYEYLDREAPVLPPSEWMMDLIHGTAAATEEPVSSPSGRRQMQFRASC